MLLVKAALQPEPEGFGPDSVGLAVAFDREGGVGLTVRRVEEFILLEISLLSIAYEGGTLGVRLRSLAVVVRWLPHLASGVREELLDTMASDQEVIHTLLRAAFPRGEVYLQHLGHASGSPGAP